MKIEKKMHPLIFLHRFKRNLKTNGLNRWLRRGLKTWLYHTAGFTLIEVIVSLAIIGISIVTILQLFSGGLRSIKVSDDYLRAAILAQNKMNELETEYSYLKSDEGVFEEDEHYRWSLRVEDYAFEELYPLFENNQDKEKSGDSLADKITLEVFWETQHGQRKMEIVTIKALTRVNPASSDILQGNYPDGLKQSRGYQFGEQDLPSGQSETKYVQTGISGRKQVLPETEISGSTTGTSVSNISGSVSELEYPTNISGN